MTVEALGARHIEAASRSGGLNIVRIAEQNYLQNPAGQQPAGRAENPRVSAFGKHDGLGRSFELRFKAFKQFHTCTSE